MKVYTVCKQEDAIRYKEEKTFSSYTKALNYIEEKVGGEITKIRVDEKGHYWEGEWYYKKYYSSVNWAKKILTRSENNEIKYFGKKYEGYSIKATKVF